MNSVKANNYVRKIQRIFLNWRYSLVIMSLYYIVTIITYPSLATLLCLMAYIFIYAPWTGIVLARLLQGDKRHVVPYLSINVLISVVYILVLSFIQSIAPFEEGNAYPVMGRDAERLGLTICRYKPVKTDIFGVDFGIKDASAQYIAYYHDIKDKSEVYFYRGFALCIETYGDDIGTLEQRYDVSRANGSHSGLYTEDNIEKTYEATFIDSTTIYSDTIAVFFERKDAQGKAAKDSLTFARVTPINFKYDVNEYGTTLPRTRIESIYDYLLIDEIKNNYKHFFDLSNYKNLSSFLPIAINPPCLYVLCIWLETIHK